MDFSLGLLAACLLLLASRLAGAHGQTLEVLQPTVPLSVKAGETLKLSCTLSGLDIPGGIRWYKGLDRGQPPVYSDKGAPPPPRVTRVVPGSNTNYDIRISSIVPNDAGTYYCVKFRSGSPEKEYKSGKGTVVSVIATPSWPLITGPPSRVEPGSLATFNCSSHGFYPREIIVVWFKDGSRVQASEPVVQPAGQSTSFWVSSTVELLLVTRDVKSKLTCQIKHRTLGGQALEQVFQLGDALRVPPRVRLEASPPSPIQLNDSVTIACIVEGFYPNDTNLVWLENDSEISLAKAAPVTRNPDGTCSLRSSLEVKATEQRNHSVFTCRVVHDSQPPINENMTLKVGVQPEENGNSHLYGTDENKIFIVVALVCALLIVLVVAAIYLVRTRQNKGKDSTAVRLHESEKTSGGTNQDTDPNNVTYADLNFEKELPKKSPRKLVEISQPSEYTSIQTAPLATGEDNVTYADLDMVHLNKAPKRPAPKPEEASSEYASVQVPSK